jgi:hypothetical protein
MIISVDEYIKYLSYIQSNNRPAIAVLPSSEKVYNIDLKTRQIETPEYLSVEHDHKSETVYFKVNRFFDYMDLSETTCIVQYITADNKARIYVVPFYDITSFSKEDKMLIPWCVDGGATATAGPIQYSIRFYKVDAEGQQFLYNLNTSPARSKILYGMEVQEMNEDYDLTPTVYDEVMAKLTDFSNRLGVYWEERY